MTRWQIRDAHFGLALVRAETEEEAVDIFYTWARKAQWRWARARPVLPDPRQVPLLGGGVSAGEEGRLRRLALEDAHDAARPDMPGACESPRRQTEAILVLRHELTVVALSWSTTKWVAVAFWRKGDKNSGAVRALSDEVSPPDRARRCCCGFGASATTGTRAT